MKALHSTVLVVLFGSVIFLGTPSRAQTCNGLIRPDALPLTDGDLFYLNGGRYRWLPPNNLNLNLSRTTRINFRYVVGPLAPGLPSHRAGVIVVKSGRVVENNEPPPPNGRNVVLKRDGSAIETSACPNHTRSDGNRLGRARRSFRKGEVSQAAYDQYHDRGGQNFSELQTIQEFHYEYERTGGHCKATDDTTPDKLFDLRSNRSQFSFDRAVVEGGLLFLISLRLIRPALAGGSVGMADQRVEVLPYRTNGGLACLNFTVPVAHVKPFVRINDLEGFAFGTRGVERSWH
jgi:hypothetical protein